MLLVKEPPGAAAHYSERLVLLPGIGTQYSPPAIPEDTDRARFSLPQDKTLLLCPQSLFKVHPENDDLLAAVLAAAPNTTLVLFEGRHPALTDRFMRRLERAFVARGIAIRERAIVLPSLSHPDYLRVNRVCDVMVDTLHWSGGNTSLDALACGLPVVTLPGTLMRGRQTAGMLAVIGATELIGPRRRLKNSTRLVGLLARRVSSKRPASSSVCKDFSECFRLLLVGQCIVGIAKDGMQPAAEDS